MLSEMKESKYIPGEHQIEQLLVLNALLEGKLVSID